MSAANWWANARRLATDARRARYMQSATRGYRGPAVCRVVGITYRQLDYWATTGLVEPSVRDTIGSGTQRLYSFEDIVTLEVIKRLLDAGISLQRIRMVVGQLRDESVPLQGLTLASDGDMVYIANDTNRIGELLTRGRAVFAVSVDPLYAELSERVAALPAERVVA
jgi:DNA-binding transcriptional MerR regulator